MDYREILLKYREIERSTSTVGKNKKVLSEAISIDADGADSAALLDILRLSGRSTDSVAVPTDVPMSDMPEEMSGEIVDVVDDVDAAPDEFIDTDDVDGDFDNDFDDEDEVDITFEDEDTNDVRYENEPDVEISDIKDAISSGNDMHKEKKQYPKAQDGDNPMTAFESALLDICKDLLNETNETNESTDSIST